jgi:ketosteroid isomerase-like protein
MSSNKEVIESYFASTGTEYARLLTDDVELIEWAEGVPVSGIRTHGRAGFVENRGNREYRTEIARMTEEANVVVAEGTARGVNPEGAPWMVHFCDIFELENGRVKRLSAFGASVKAPP